ncbi:hypothetical protein F5Y16DRAFT_400316 [Xylariaceae sp. FL0255]|nr:hypothetical protein F5Y16DRAFT_400316 [Xylariaceae sp. FL0255]
MWFLETKDLDRLELVEVSDESTPTYAILSHTWYIEVSFQDMQELSQSKWFEKQPLEQPNTALDTSFYILGLFQSGIPGDNVRISLTVGLEHKPGGGWGVWHLEQATKSEDLDKEVRSIRDQIASIRQADARGEQAPVVKIH